MTDWIVNFVKHDIGPIRLFYWALFSEWRGITPLPPLSVCVAYVAGSAEPLPANDCANAGAVTKVTKVAATRIFLIIA
jgi:hypothetical protein